jgi:hypothetical protein
LAEVWVLAEAWAEADGEDKVTSEIMREVSTELGMKFDLHQTIGRLNTCGIINGPARASFR